MPVVDIEENWFQNSINDPESCKNDPKTCKIEGVDHPQFYKFWDHFLALEENNLWRVDNLMYTSY